MTEFAPEVVIPIIDMGPFLNGSPEDRMRVANEIGKSYVIIQTENDLTQLTDLRDYFPQLLIHLLLCDSVY